MALRPSDRECSAVVWPALPYRSLREAYAARPGVDEEPGWMLSLGHTLGPAASTLSMHIGCANRGVSPREANAMTPY